MPRHDANTLITIVITIGIMQIVKKNPGIIIYFIAAAFRNIIVVRNDCLDKPPPSGNDSGVKTC